MTHHQSSLAEVLGIVADILREHSALYVYAANVFHDPQDGHKPQVSLAGPDAAFVVSELGGKVDGLWRNIEGSTVFEERSWTASAHGCVWTANEQRKRRP